MTSDTSKNLIYQKLSFIDNSIKDNIQKDLLIYGDLLIPYLLITYQLIRDINNTFIKLSSQSINTTDTAINILISYYSKKADLSKLQKDFRSQFKIGTEMNNYLTEICKYSHFSTCFQAFKKDRYTCNFDSENTLIFNHTNLQIDNYKLESWYSNNPEKLTITNAAKRCKQRFEKKLFDLVKKRSNIYLIKSIETYEKQLFNELLGYFLETYIWFDLELSNGLYAVLDFQKVWLYLTFQCLLQKYNNKNLLLIYFFKSDLVNHCSLITGIHPSIVSCVINDITYNASENNAYTNFQRTPLFLSTDDYIYTAPSLMSSINSEVVLEKTWKIKYPVYDSYHTNVIEPLMCNNLAHLFCKFRRYMVVTPKQHYPYKGTSVQIDVLIFDKTEESLLIVEAKDHLSPTGTLELVRQDSVEKSILYKEKGAVSQLIRQESFIRDTSILESIFGEKINVKYVLKGICEKSYVGTNSLYENLNTKNIAFFPYYLLLNSELLLNNGLMFIHDYFINKKFIVDGKYEVGIETAELYGYKISFPLFFIDN
ncbi:hypothetical protein [Heliobacterium mobile]|nr:hypothetical protein [Heliobacterium mobile]